MESHAHVRLDSCKSGGFSGEGEGSEVEGPAEAEDTTLWNAYCGSGVTFPRGA